MELSAGEVLALALALTGSYLAGSVPFGLLLARRRGVDIRQVGSGNIGATNVARNLGRGLGALVLLLDAGKGALAVIVARLAVGDEDSLPWFIAAAGFGAVSGHCFSLWLRGRGGKGVATALGVMLAAVPLAAAIGVGTFVLVALVSRWVSLASMLATLAVALAVGLLGEPRAHVLLACACALVIVTKHHENIARMWRRKEPRIGGGPKPS